MRGNHKHGHAKTGQKTRTYFCWRNMLERCYNKKNKRYHRYGGIGILVCKKWRTFEGFLEDMGECPPEMTLERENNKHGYSLQNCKWIPKKDQQKNTCRTIRITIGKLTMCARDWDRYMGFGKGVVRTRYHNGLRGDDLLAPKFQVRNLERK